MRSTEQVRKIVENAHDEWGYKYHILPVVKNAAFLAKKLGADFEVVEVAAYLHDLGVSKKIAGEKGVEKENNHHIVGAKEAQKALKELGYSSDFIEKVVNCILSHRGRKGPRPVTIEQKIIANADAMAHFETFPYLLAFFVKQGGPFEEVVEDIYGKMQRDWEIKLTLPEAKEMIKPKYEAIMVVLESMKNYF